MPDDAVVCCAMEICCGGENGKSRDAFARWLKNHASLSESDAARVAQVTLQRYALAPRSFAKVAEEIGKMAREHGYNE